MNANQRPGILIGSLLFLFACAPAARAQFSWDDARNRLESLAEDLTQPKLDYAEPASETIWSGSAGVERKLDVTILAEGYTRDDIGRFRGDADRFLAELRSSSPFRENMDRIRVHIVNSISRNSGADHPASLYWVDTAFDASYTPGVTVDQQRFLYVYNRRNVLDAASRAPESDTILVIVNDAQYGGGGIEFGVGYNGRSLARVLVHELGHSLGGLCDEYEDGGLPAPSLVEPPFPNATIETSLANLKWRHLVTPGSALPSDEEAQGGIGLFEGALYNPNGIFRPKAWCKMRDDSMPFCQVCSEVLARRIWDFSSRRLPFPVSEFLLLDGQSTTPTIEWQAVSTLTRVQAYHVHVVNLRTRASVLRLTSDPRLTLGSWAPALRGDLVRVVVQGKNSAGLGPASCYEFTLGAAVQGPERLRISDRDGPDRPTIEVRSYGRSLSWPLRLRIERAGPRIGVWMPVRTLSIMDNSWTAPAGLMGSGTYRIAAWEVNRSSSSVAIIVTR